MSFSPLKIPTKNLFILLGDQRHGPFTIDDLRKKFDGAEIGRGTFLWYPGLLNWVTVGDIPDFDRRDIAAPPTAVAAKHANQFWVYDRGNVVAMHVDDLRQQIRDNRFRRADLVYHEPENKWMRSDQYPDFAQLFRPAVPPPNAPALPSTAPPQLKVLSPDDAPKWSWFYSGVGFAVLLILLSYAVRLWDMEAVVSNFRSKPRLAPVQQSDSTRSPASVQTH